jgi:hypothetical protein
MMCWARVTGVVVLVAFTSSGATIDRDMLCVTEGAIQEAAGHRLSVNAPKMRAYINRLTPQNVEAAFTYRGPSEKQAPLGSGEVRQQFGLKLRAEDACNLVYVMWRIEPESKLVVSIKSNPGQHTSAECGNRGYINIKPVRSSPVPILNPGDGHRLRAEMTRDSVRVWVDNAVVWEGRVGMEALNFNGPVGVRSDNVNLEFTLHAEPQPLNGPSPPCTAGGEQD